MLFNALAFPWYFFDHSGMLVHKGEGSLFAVPPECASDQHLHLYGSIRREGWHRCHLGYAVFARKILTSETSIAVPGYLIIPGLKVRGRSSIQGKSVGLTIYTEDSHIERHVNSVLQTEGQLNERFDRLTRQNTHEIRGLNNGLYHAAEELKRSLREASIRVARQEDLVKSITALSQILSVRLDLVNYLSDEEMTETIDEIIPVYKKFDKMRKCFVAQADKKKITLQMRGASYSSTYGPSNSVEIVAYLLLDNAIKYSPHGKTVTIQVNDQYSIISAVISSIGPSINDQEVDKIFEMDFRSHEAVRSGRPGSGIGLNVLKRLVVDAFGGRVSVIRGGSVTNIKTVQFDEISFIIELPIHR